jgi:hypothetical protein
MFVGWCRPARMQQATVVFTVPASAGEAAASTDDDQRHTRGREQG